MPEKTNALDVIVIGTGPYGLGASAHLRSVKGLEIKTFGEPMSFWKDQMPAGMLLRSSWEASNLWDPKRRFTLDAYKKADGNHIPSPVPLERFVDYGLWFQKNAVPDIDRREIGSVERDDREFRVVTSDGEVIKSRKVVVAAGISPFARRPEQFKNISSAFASHTSEHRDLSAFRGKQVVVVGAGQSALESAALLHEAGAKVEVIARAPEMKWLGWKKRIQSLGPVSKIFYSWTDVGPAAISRLVSIPGLLQRFPRETQDRLRIRSVRPAGAFWLLARLKPVLLTTGRSISSVMELPDGVRLKLDDGSERVADHVFLGTGYRVDVSRYRFLGSNLLEGLRRHSGYPELGPGFESSIPGLHFLGAPAAWSFGPLMNFVSGTRYAGATLTRYITTNAKID